jgi:hypothetical protein
MSGAARAEKSQVEVFAERHPPSRARVCIRVVLAQPAQLRGQVRRVKDAPGARVRGDRIHLAPQRGRRTARACVSPREHARGRPPGRVDTHEAVPERRDGDGRDLTRAASRIREDDVDRGARGPHALVRIDGRLAVGGDAEGPVRMRDAARDRPRAPVEKKDAQARRADVDREH